MQFMWSKPLHLKMPEILKQSVPERWKFAKRIRLCSRCLAEGHLRHVCPRSRHCGQDGCQKLHHWLLHTTGHFSDVTPSCAGDQSQTETNFAANAVPKYSPPAPATQIGDAISFGTEGKSNNKQTLTAVTYTTYSSKSVERSKSRKRTQSREKSPSMERSKCMERSMSIKRSKSMERLESRKISQSRETSKTGETSRTRETSKSIERSKTRENSKSRDRGETKKRWKSKDRAKFTKSLKRYRSKRRPKLRNTFQSTKRFESRKESSSKTSKREMVPQGCTMHKSKLLSSRSGNCTSAK